MVKRCASVCVRVFGISILVAGVVAAVGSPSGAVIPPGRTLVAVSPETVVSGKDAALLDAGSIEGAVAALAGGNVSATVIAYANGTQVAFGFTSGGGGYEIGGLPTGSYDVCVPPGFVSGGNSTTGYLGRCYPNIAFNGSTVPAAATEVAVTAGTPTTGIDINIPSGAAISGKIMNSGGAGIGEVNLIAKNRSTGQVFPGFTSGNGSYKIDGLTPSGPGYSLCADPGFSPAGATGYLPHCFKNVAWNGGAIPSGANAISVSAGHTHTGVNITLPRGAAVSGRSTDAGNGNPVPNSVVAVFSSTGHELGLGVTNAQGLYTVKGLPTATGNVVCDFQTALGPATAYKAECFKNIAWSGNPGALPSGTTKVSTTVAHTRSNVNFTLSKITIHLGSIAGTVTDAVGANPLVNAQVVLFGSNGHQIDSTPTDSSGGYQFSELDPNATGYRVCAKAITGTFESPVTPTGGFAPRCYSDASWNGVTTPSAATKIPISPGQNKGAVDIALPRGGGVSGTTFKSDATTPAGGVFVTVFTPGGTLLGSATSGLADGTFSIVNLAPSATGYAVCYDGRNAGAFFGTAGYLPQCYDGVAWDGTP